MITTKTKKDLKDVWAEPRGFSNKDAYYVIHGKNQNVTILISDKNGNEFNKTHGHFHNYPGAEMYNCLYGQGILVMQRNDEEAQAKEFKIVMLSPGKQVEVPSGFGHCLVNIGKTFLAVLDNAPTENSKLHDYQTVKQKHGFTYYIVEKKGEIGFELNPNYRVHPQIIME